ncbi:MAG: hypothetical protein OXC60_06420 [Litoreibacter sp.]|nr:hypothetical protein [Litoreibacter sp.]
MNILKQAVFLASCAVLTACSGSDQVTRGSGLNPETLVQSDMREASKTWNVKDVRVTAPKSLKVSEANLYYPWADIVWRGEPFGNRHAQVERILDFGLTRGLNHLDGPRAVNVDITLKRFHALTEKARVSVGGVHNIIFDLSVRDAVSGALMHGPVEIELDLKAYGGARALQAMQRGHTQKVRIESHLTNTMRRQFGAGKINPITYKPLPSDADLAEPIYLPRDDAGANG